MSRSKLKADMAARAVDRIWTTMAVLVSETLDLASGAAPRASGGGAAIVRDVLAVPGPIDNEDGTITPGGWQPGSVSTPPAAVARVAAALGRRVGAKGRHGVRIYLARVPAPNTVASWTAQIPALAEAVQAAQVGAWGPPDVVVAWRGQSTTIATAVGQAFPGVPFRWATSTDDLVAAVRSVHA